MADSDSLLFVFGQILWDFGATNIFVISIYLPANDIKVLSEI